GLEIFPFGLENARYVKYNGKGNSKDTWNNINEIYIGGQIVNVKPVSESKELTTPQNSAVSGTLSASDANGDPLTYSIVSNGILGTAVVTNPSTGAFTYTPSPGAFGTDTFVFIVNDGYENSDVSTMTVRLLDVTPPMTTDDGQSGWHKVAQTIHLTASDEASGVAKTFYSVNGSPFAEGNTVQMDVEGLNELKYYSIDAAGNQETQKSVTIKIDKTGPVITPTVSMAVYVTDTIQLNFLTTDPLSGVKDTTIKLDGQTVAAPYAIEPLSLSIGNHVVVVTATDRVGNKNEQSFVLQVKVDINHLDEALTIANQKGWIKNEGIYKALMALVNLVQKAPSKDVNHALNALENLVQAQRGRFIDETISKKLLEWITALKTS
ncbi:Ig-like domain-containing protein, partial [Paenibacillus sp. TAF58]